MDYSHIAELVVVAIFGAGGAWSAVTLKVKYLERWTEKHEASDDKHFDQVNARLNTLLSKYRAGDVS